MDLSYLVLVGCVAGLGAEGGKLGLRLDVVGVQKVMRYKDVEGCSQYIVSGTGIRQPQGRVTFPRNGYRQERLRWQSNHITQATERRTYHLGMTLSASVNKRMKRASTRGEVRG